jgi:hypothetical protein
MPTALKPASECLEIPSLQAAGPACPGHHESSPVTATLDKRPMIVLGARGLGQRPIIRLLWNWCGQAIFISYYD